MMIVMPVFTKRERPEPRDVLRMAADVRELRQHLVCQSPAGGGDGRAGGRERPAPGAPGD